MFPIAQNKFLIAKIHNFAIDNLAIISNVLARIAVENDSWIYISLVADVSEEKNLFLEF